MAPEAEVKAIGEAVGKSGKPYTRIELSDGKSFPVFDKKMLEGVRPGVRVHYEAERNERGFDNLTELHPLRQAIQTPSEQLGERPVEQQTGKETNERNRAIFSANALNAAINLYVALLQRDVVQPTTGKEAVAHIRILWAEMMRLHDTDYREIAERLAEKPREEMTRPHKPKP